MKNTHDASCATGGGPDAICVIGAVVLAGIALAAAGCGGTKTPAVARLPAPTTSSTTAANPDSGPFSQAPGVGFGASTSITVAGAAGVRYSSCMQSHGLPAFPDPNGQGVITVTSSPSLNPASPLFESAEADCQHLLPPGRGLSQAQVQRRNDKLLAFAACMRAHGVPSYPDPTFGPGGTVSQGFGRGMGIDPSSPIFQAAQRACGVSGPGAVGG